MYIRTKDSVYDTNKYHYEIEIDVLYEIVWDDPYTEYGVNGKYSRGKVIAQSENLEELCDKFVTLSKYSNRHYEYLTLKGAINMRKKLPYEVCEIYGAIWTDKGLIYVAKMDNEGKLVLIWK